MATSTKTTNQQPKTTEKTVDDKTQITQQVVLKPWQKIDANGNIYDDPTLLQQEQKERADFLSARGVDGNYKYTGTRGDLFGFNPDRFIEEQKAKERLERFKQKEAGWKNAIGVISDIIIAGHGGNVWERQPDNVAAKANAKAEGYQDSAIKMANAIPQAIAAREKEAREADMKRLNDKIAAQGTRVNIQQTQGGGYKKEEKGGEKTVTTNNSSNGGGSGSSKNYKIAKFADKDNNSQEFRMSDKSYTAIANYLNRIYKQDQDIIRTLAKYGIRRVENGTDRGNFKLDQLMQGGIIINTPQVVSEVKKIINEDTELTEEEKKSIEANLRFVPINKTQPTQVKTKYKSRINLDSNPSNNPRKARG